jgi:hypothetical protein
MAAPKISSIATSGAGITAGKGDLGPGSTVTLPIKFSENVFVDTNNGMPTLLLNDGGTAIYGGGSGSNALIFDYTVGALGSGENTPDLRLVAINALRLNGATVSDDAGNAAVLTRANNYNPAGTLQIDTTAPTVSKVVALPGHGELTTGHMVRITIDISEAMRVSGSPVLLLDDGGTASYDSVRSSPKALVFDDTVASGQVTTDLAVSGIQLPAISSIEDIAGNNANLSGAGADLGLQINTKATGPAGPSGGNFIVSGTTELELFGASSANVSFAAGGGTFRLDAASSLGGHGFTGTIAGFAGLDAIDLSAIGFGANTTLGYSANGNNTGGTLTVTDGTHTANIALLGNYMASSFATASDGHGGTMITDAFPTGLTPLLVSTSHA